MTTAQLYALYVRAYRDAPRLLGAGIDPELLGRASAAPRPPVARVVALLALHDVSDGKPMRSRALFERAVAEGERALAPLGLRTAAAWATRP